LRILAVDPGSKRVGVALSDPTETIAQALATVPAAPEETLPRRLAEIALSHEAKRIIVGLPLRLDGTHGPEAATARRLADSAGCQIVKFEKAKRTPLETLCTASTTSAGLQVNAHSLRASWRQLVIDSLEQHSVRGMERPDKPMSKHGTPLPDASGPSDVLLHGPSVNSEDGRDFAIAEALCAQMQALPLPRRQGTNSPRQQL